MNHDVRIVPLDGRAPLPGSLRQWAGVSRGRWEGETLVVKTTNFTDKTTSFNPITRPFTALVPMQKSDQPVFEYACHEGNSGLMHILRGARAEDAAQSSPR